MTATVFFGATWTFSHFNQMQVFFLWERWKSVRGIWEKWSRLQQQLSLHRPIFQHCGQNWRLCSLRRLGPPGAVVQKEKMIPWTISLLFVTTSLHKILPFPHHTDSFENDKNLGYFVPELFWLYEWNPLIKLYGFSPFAISPKIHSVQPMGSNHQSYRVRKKLTLFFTKTEQHRQQSKRTRNSNNKRGRNTLWNSEH